MPEALPEIRPGRMANIRRLENVDAAFLDCDRRVSEGMRVHGGAPETGMD